MLRKLKLLVLLPLLAACSGSPVQTDTIGEPVGQTTQLVEVMSVAGTVLAGAEIVGQASVVTDDFGLAHVAVNPAGTTILEARAKGFQPKQFTVSRPAHSADDTRTLLRLDPLP